MTISPRPDMGEVEYRTAGPLHYGPHASTRMTLAGALRATAADHEYDMHGDPVVTDRLLHAADEIDRLGRQARPRPVRDVLLIALGVFLGLQAAWWADDLLLMELRMRAAGYSEVVE